MSTNKAADSKEKPDERKVPKLEDVQLLAYDRYLKRNRVDGHHLEDWLEAERELHERLNTELLEINSGNGS